MKYMMQLAAALFAAPFLLIANPGPALADRLDCTGTSQAPAFPGYGSGAILSTITNSRASTQPIPIRRGWYCVPVGSTNEFVDGKGFGLDKVQHRHHIGRQQVGWHQSEAILAVKAVLNSTDVRQKSDGWGGGWTFHAWQAFGEGCTYEQVDMSCERSEQMHVVGAATSGGADYDPQGGMPAGTPLGLQTVYCDFNGNNVDDDNGPELRCGEWVTAGLVDLAEDLNLN